MPKNVFITDASAIPDYLGRYAHGDPQLQRYLTAMLADVLATPFPPDPQLIRHRELEGDRGATGFQLVYEFKPNPSINKIVEVMSDWLKNEMAHHAEWLANTDAQGIPTRLHKITTWDKVLHYVNEWQKTKAVASVASEHPDDVGFHCKLQDGYHIVQLKTRAAIIREGNEMQHCLGDGDYDALVGDASYRIYSMRDAHNKPHVTFFVHIEDDLPKLIECRGKQNDPPVKKYLPLVQAFVRKEKFSLESPVADTNLLQAGQNYYDIHHLPEQLTVFSDLNLSYTAVEKLPDSLNVKKSVFLAGTKITRLPDDFSFNGSLNLANTPIVALPDDMTVNGTLTLAGCAQLKQLPKGLVVNGNLLLGGSEITSLPDDLVVKGKIFGFTGFQDKLQNTGKARIRD